MTQEEADSLSISIYEKVISLPEFQEASCIYAYVDYNKEASTREIIRKAWREGKRVAVPKVTGPHEMKYYYLEDFFQLKPGYFQIPEPEDCPGRVTTVELFSTSRSSSPLSEGCSGSSGSSPGS